MVAFPSIRAPSSGAAEDIQPKVLVAEFGDGYFQRAGDGLNAVASEFTLTWENLEEPDASTLDAFLRPRAGVEVIDWTPPRWSAAGMFIVPRWSRSAGLAGFDTFVVAFKQVFDL